MLRYHNAFLILENSVTRMATQLLKMLLKLIDLIAFKINEICIRQETLLFRI